MRQETIAVHGGFSHDPSTHAVVPPIHQTVAYEFDSADHGAALFDLEVEGYRYSRFANPTVDILERRLAMLEGGRGALCFGSGQAALSAAFLTIADGGGNIVATPRLYGTTHTLLAHTLRRHGVEARFARSESPADMAAMIDSGTKALFAETVGNPSGAVADVGALAQAAHARGVPLIVDSTVASPALLRPIEHGADIVVHSLTKYIGGHGSAMGGAIIDSGAFDWRARAARFPMLCAPDPSYHGLVYVDRFGADAYLARARSVYLRTGGAVLSPMSAFLLLQGAQTLSLRMERHVENGRKVADALRADKRVAWVDYAGFSDSPYKALADKYLGGKVPPLLSFGIAGGFEAAKAFYDALKLVKRLVNIGDVRSLCCHPASTTHRQMKPHEQLAAGVRPEGLRLSVGIEHSEDILADLDQALAASGGLKR
jgi:O-acetylhomoserine (thiol)-lyase